VKKKIKKIKRAGKFWVYILECADGAYYTGYTDDLNKRLARHNAGLASKCTRSRLPAKLVWRRQCRSKSAALKLEARIKRMSREGKEELVRGNA
jgi:putative endonuclease